MRKIIICFLIVLFTAGGCFFIFNKKMPKELSYDEFNNITEEIYKEVLSKKYDDVIVRGPMATIIPGNPQNAWTKEKFNIVNNNALAPQKVTLIIRLKDYFTKVDMIYTPENHNKYYTNIDYIYQHESFLEDKFKDALNSYSAGFTTNGMVIEVMTVSLINDSDDVISQLIAHNNDVIMLIQEHILKNKY